MRETQNSSEATDAQMRSPVDKERDCDINCSDPMLLHQEEQFWERSLWIGTPSQFLNGIVRLKIFVPFNYITYYWP